MPDRNVVVSGFQQAEALSGAPLTSVPAPAADSAEQRVAPIPPYLVKYYEWAYLHPLSPALLDNFLVVNFILWGQYGRLRDEAIREFGPSERVLQVACAYGDLTPKLSQQVCAMGGRLDVVDVVPRQLANLRRKLNGSPATLLQMDSGDLALPDERYDRTLLFFLLHEQPSAKRRSTLAEALRVTKPGGKLVIVDYNLPQLWNPWRYWFAPFLFALEPFAADLWRAPLASFLPAPWSAERWPHKTYFGGLYQKLVITK